MTKRSHISSHQRDLSSYMTKSNIRIFPHIRGTIPPSHMTKHSHIPHIRWTFPRIWLNIRTLPHIRGTFPRLWINIRTFPHKNLKDFSSYSFTSSSGFYFTPHLVFLDLRFIHYSLDLRFRKEKNLKEKQTKIQVCSFCGKAKPKVETSNLRNLKTMPRNLDEIVLSWIKPLK